MHRTDHARLETILAYRRPRSSPKLFTRYKALKPILQPLSKGETIRNGDVVEDIETGTREVVTKTGFYGFLRGIPVEKAKDMPAIFEVLRRR